MDPVKIDYMGKTYDFPVSSFGQCLFNCGGIVVKVGAWFAGKPQQLTETNHPADTQKVGNSKVWQPVENQ